jgi:HEPN domain-containing protein
MKKLQPLELQLAIQFSETLTNTDLWIRQAEELLAAAKVLEAEVKKYWSEVRVEAGQVVSGPSRKNLQGPYFLLTAYAIENYFKALLIHKNRESFRNKLLTKLPNYVKEHDLLRLARQVSKKLTIEE